MSCRSCWKWTRTSWTSSRVERDGIIPPQFLVIFCLVVVESFLVAEFSQQHMPTHNAGDWARGRAGGGAEALQRRTALRGGTELSGIGIYRPRVATRRGRLGTVRKGKEGFHLRKSSNKRTLEGIGMYRTRVATRRGRLGNIQKSSRRGLRKALRLVGDRPGRICGHDRVRHRLASRWCHRIWSSHDRRYVRGGARPAWRVTFTCLNR